MASRKIEVEIVGDNASLKRALGDSTKHTSAFGSALKTMAKAGVLAAGAAGIGAVFVTLKQGISEWRESTLVAAQTAAVLKSTGGQANVTAGQVDNLATSLMRKSGVDDEAIKSGENMLLTFTRIHNEAGKGNDIFNQATGAILNMDTAMSHGNVTAENMAKTSILVGKALNDPIKGITALSRVGVTFDAATKENIKSLVAHGETLKAQKIILAELNKEFGGSAEAMGKTLPGQINILKESFNNLAGDIVAKMIPTLQTVVSWTAAHWPEIERVFKTVFAAIGTGLTALVAFFQANWPKIQAAGEAVAKWYRENLQPTIVSVANNIEKAWDSATDKMNRDTNRNFGALSNTVTSILKQIVADVNVTLAVIRGDWPTAWEQFKKAAISNMTAILSFQKAFKAGVQSAAAAIGRAIVNGIVAALAPLVAAVVARFTAMGQVMNGWIGRAFQMSAAIGRAIVRGIIGGIAGLPGQLAGKLHGYISSAISAAGAILHGSGEFMATKHLIGKPLAQGVIDGWRAGIIALFPAMAASLKTALTKAKATIAETMDRLRGQLSTAFGGVAGKILVGFDRQTSAALDAIRMKFSANTPAEQALADLQAGEAAAGRANELASAQQTYNEAIEDATKATNDAERKTAQAAIASATAQLHAAVVAGQIYDLEVQASKERTAANEAMAKAEQDYTDARGVARDELVRDLDLFGTALEAGKVKIGDLDAVLAPFGLSIGEVTTLLGTGDEGFTGALAETKFQVDTLGLAASMAAAQLAQIRADAFAATAAKLVDPWMFNLPHLATGGRVASTGAAVIHKGETVVPAGAGGGGVTVNFFGTVTDKREIQRLVTDAVVQATKRGSLFASDLATT